MVLWDLTRNWWAGQGHEDGVEPPQAQGLMTRLLRPLLRLIQHSWQMYLVGFLFGLGFDTATEVGILALSARSGQSGLPLWAVMLLPGLFTAGMCLIDTLDGLLMLRAYGWAFVEPARKLTYNLVITGVSALVAFAVGTNELVQILADRSWLTGRAAEMVRHLDFAYTGYAIIALFLLLWGLSLLAYRARAAQKA